MKSLLCAVAIFLCTSALAKEALDPSLAKANAEFNATSDAAQAPTFRDARAGSDQLDDGTIPHARKHVAHDVSQADHMKRHVKHAKTASSVKKAHKHAHKKSKKGKKVRHHKSPVA